MKRKDFVILASLLHDIGKLLERADFYPDILEDEHYKSVCFSKNNFYSHCAYTLKFCEELEAKFDCLRQAKDEDKRWKMWAALHHSDEEQDFEAKVVKFSDQLSAKEREEGEYYIKEQIHKRTMLEPVLERVFLGKNNKNYTSYRYLPVKLKIEKDCIFPLNSKELKTLEHLSLEISISQLKKQWYEKGIFDARGLTGDYEVGAGGKLTKIEEKKNVSNSKR
jgi:hypothetical protein